MVRWIVGTCLKFRALVVAVAAALLVFGVVQLREASVDVYPEFSPPRVEIQTEAIGLSAAEVEQLITVPMEQILLNGVAWLDEIHSASLPGLSSIELIFEPGTDPLRARQMVQERLTQTGILPRVGKSPVMIQPLSSTSRITMIRLSSQELSLIDLSVLARWTIRPRLMGVPGVANVAIWGQRERQLQVQVDPARLQAQGVTLNQVIETTGNALWVSPLSFLEASTPGSGGFIDTPNQRLGLQHRLPINTPEDLAQVSLAGCRGGPGTSCPTTLGNRPRLRLGDVATVVEDHQPLIGDAVSGDGPGLMLVIEKFPEANTLEVTRGVEAALDELRPGLAGVAIDSSIFRPASYIETAIANLGWALLLGSLLVLLVLALFLFEWRSVLIGIVAIPLSLLAAGLVLHLRGAPINTMVLAGLVIAVGVVVDDAITGVENIVRRLRQQRQAGSGRATAAVILDASLEVRAPLAYATLVLLVAVMPLFFLGGPLGPFFRPLALAYALAVLASMAVALTVTPALALLLLARAPLTGGGSPLVPRLQRGYAALLARIVRRPRGAYVAAALAIAVGAAVVPTLGQAMLPAFKERDFLMHWVAKPGTSHPEMVRITTQGSRELRAVPGVQNFGAHIGQADAADEVVGMYFAENWISVDPAADYDATLAAVQETVDGYPGLYRDVQTYLKERIREVLAGSSDTLVVRLYGQDLQVLRAKAEEVRRVIGEVDGIVEEHVELQVEEPQLEIEVDLAAAQRHGLKPGDVRRAVSALVASEETGDLYYGGKVYDVRVIGTPAVRHSVTSVRELLLDTPGGGQVRLGDVAQVRLAPTPNVIKREGLSRRIDISANVRGRSLGAVAGEVDRALGGVAFPREYHAEVLGEYAERQAAEGRLRALALAAGAGVFLLLQAAFGGWRLATVVFLTLPMALVGGVLATRAVGGVVSLGSLVGFFTVLGIAGRNGIMLVSHYQHLEGAEGEPFGAGLVLRGARERLAPILMTALATGLALVPLVAAGSIPGHEIEHPMAVVILGGLATSTLLNLFVLPPLYLRFGSTRPALTRDVGLPPL